MPSKLLSARRETALIVACRKGDEAAVAHALSVLPSGQVDAVDVDGLSALVHAALCLRARYPQKDSSTEACGAAYERIVRLLLKQGARVDLVDRHGSNALHHASFMGHTMIAAALLERVAPSAIDTERANGESALSVAAFRNHAGVAQLLLKARASVNKQSPKGGSALMLAASQGHTPMVELLLSAAADAGLRAASGATALQIAQAQGHLEVAALLRGLEVGMELLIEDGRRKLQVVLERGEGLDGHLPVLHHGPSVTPRLPHPLRRVRGRRLPDVHDLCNR